MLPRYADSYLEGGLKPNAHVRTVLDAGAMLRLDGQAGFGQVVGHEAMALGIERAKQHGCCVMALGNAHHLGRIGAWAEQAAAAGLVSLHFVNVISRGIVAPHGGSDARFGTNPFTAGDPAEGPRADDPGLRHQRDRAGQDARRAQQGRAGAARSPDRPRRPADAGPALLGDRAVRRDPHVRRAQGLWHGGAVRAARRRAGRRHGAAQRRHQQEARAQRHAHAC